MKKVLITGAGTGLATKRLSGWPKRVSTSSPLSKSIRKLRRFENQAKERGVNVQIEKLDVTNEGDRRKALGWNVEILVNNAGMLEGGSVVDIPGDNMRHEF